MDAHQPALGGHTKLKKQEPPNSKHNSNRDGAPACGELWAEGLICAFELVRGPRPPNPSGFTPRAPRTAQINDARFASTNASEDGIPNSPAVAELGDPSPVPCKTDQVTRVYEGKDYHDRGSGRPPACHWVPIGWPRINELVQTMHVNGSWASQQLDLGDDGYDLTVADLAAPYWERPVGPTWWCHVAAEHRSIKSWLSNAQWLHPAISTALMDESRLISERMKYLFYEVPVRAAGGLLFELLGQSVGDPFCDEDDIPIVLRCWQTKNCLLTALHIKGSAANINVLGITEVQEILYAGGSITPRSSHEIIAHLACRLSRWDDRLFRKFVFGAADEIELKFVNRRNQEDMNLLCVILNQEIRKLAMQVIRVKWSLHAREEIIFELLQHLKGAITRSILEGIRKSTREMLEEQEAVRGRLFTIQDVMQSTVRAWLQDKSLHITHNLTIFGGCGLVLSIITGLFGINVDGIPGAEHTPFAFALFSGILFLIGIILIGVGMLYFGLKKPLTEEKVHVRRLELEQLVSMFQHDAKTHAKVRKDVSRHNLPPTAADMISDTDYILIS